MPLFASRSFVQRRELAVNRGQRQDPALPPSEQERFDPGIVEAAGHGDTMPHAGRDCIRVDPDARSENPKRRTSTSTGLPLNDAGSLAANPTAKSWGNGNLGYNRFQAREL